MLFFFLKNFTFDNSTADVFEVNSLSMPFFCEKTSWMGRIVTDRKFPSLDILHSTFDQYVVSFYWTSITLVCTGYGDVVAKNRTDMVASSFTQISGTIFYSFVVGEICARLQTEDIRRGHYRGRMSDINKFFKAYGFKKEVQEEVKHKIN